TMDRPTASRNFRHVPNLIAHAALAGRGPLRVNSLEGVGDYIHAEDLARAILALLAAPRLNYSVYNVGAGTTTTVGDFVAWAQERVSGFQAELSPAADADLVQDPGRRDGMWGAYDISRIKAETGWCPRPVRQAFHGYMDWIMAQR